MFLKQSREVLADECPNIEKGDHNGEHTEKTKGHLPREKCCESRRPVAAPQALALRGISSGDPRSRHQLRFNVFGKIQSQKETVSLVAIKMDARKKSIKLN